MHIRGRSLDDLLHKTYRRLLSGAVVVASRGSTLERTGVLLTLNNPRARLSVTESRGKIFSALGELLWYLSGSDSAEHIAFYIGRYLKEQEADGSVHGAYGPRLLNGKRNQIRNIIDLLTRKPTSRRAVIQLFDASDLDDQFIEIPCTCTIQFLVRGARLDAFVNMRSNDAYWGLPHDIFAFTMLQELIARSLELELGEYKHFVGSLHVYSDYVKKLEEYVDEGWQGVSSMPAMPKGCQLSNLKSLLSFEQEVRTARRAPESPPPLPDYWRDLATLLRIHRAQKNRAGEEKILNMMRSTNETYHPYILPVAMRAAARDAAARSEINPKQDELFSY